MAHIDNVVQHMGYISVYHDGNGCSTISGVEKVCHSEIGFVVRKGKTYVVYRGLAVVKSIPEGQWRPDQYREYGA